MQRIKTTVLHKVRKGLSYFPYSELSSKLLMQQGHAAEDVIQLLKSWGYHLYSLNDALLFVDSSKDFHLNFYAKI